MQSTYEWISLIIQAGILAVLVDIAWHIRQVNKKTGVSLFMKDKPTHLGVFSLHHDRHIGPIKVAIAYSIWVYRGGSWTLLKPCGQPHCHCGKAPDKAGEYEGQVIRKECPQS
jgi:hypothetical protein